MASPIGAAGVAGLGEQQLKSLIQIWIQEAIRDNGRGGIGLALGFNGASFSNYAVTTGITPVCSANIVVPTGFTSAVALVTCDATAKNTTGTSGYLYVSASAASSHGGEAYATAPAAGYGTAAASAGQAIPGLVAGSNLVISANVRSDVAWAATASNIANVNGIVVFLR
jgi:hypothetical protein